VKARALRAGTSAVAVILGVALLVGINYLSARHWARGDWTSTRIYSISEQTKKILAGLKSPVRVTVFMTAGARLYQPVRELLSRYQALSPKIEVEYLDPTRNVARAEALLKEFGVRQNTVVFRSGDRKKYVEEDKLADFDFAAAQMGGTPTIKAFKGEEAFTSAILAVSEQKQPKIVFTQGHNEAALESSERGRGYSEAKQLLERDNMTVATWASLGKDDLPAGTDVVVVAGPRTAFLEPEAGALEKHLAAGGHALILLDPVLPGPGSPPPDLGFAGLLGKYGLRLGNDIVVDPSNALPMVGAETVLANKYGTHPIVRPLSAESLPVVFPLARSVTKAEKPPDGVAETMLVETSAEGWGETNLKALAEGNGAIQKEPGDTPGPVSIAVALGPADEKTADGKVPRLVVIGNSRFAGDGSIANGGNGVLLANAIHWLTGSEKQIGIAPKTIEQASLSLTDSQVRRIGIFSVAVLPGLAILLGIWVWYRRRD
jgi:ABC-type uncharacterized transport system involved in gliding motility auxiliary subunit